MSNTIYIDADGYLERERKGILRKQYCPYAITSRCGDWCPLFRDPCKKNDGWTELQLCGTTLSSDHFADLRANRGGIL